MKYIIVCFCFLLCLHADGLQKTDVENVLAKLTKDIAKKPIKIMVDQVSFENNGVFGLAGANVLSLLEKVLEEKEEYTLVKTNTTRSIQLAKIVSCYQLKIFYNKETILFSLQQDEKIISEEQVSWEITNHTLLLPSNALSLADALKMQKKSSQNDFSILMTTNKGKTGAVFKNGEKLILEIEVTKSCYVDIFYHQANNEIVQIFPNQYHADNYLEAGKVYHIPNENYAFDLEIDTNEVAGIEVIRAVASKKKLPVLPGIALGMGLRGIKITAKEITKEVNKNQDTTEANCQILTSN